MKKLFHTILLLCLFASVVIAAEVQLDKRDAKLLQALDRTHLGDGKEMLEVIAEMEADGDPLANYMKAYMMEAGYGWVGKIDKPLAKKLYTEACQSIVKSKLNAFRSYYAAICFGGQYGLPKDGQKEKDYLAQNLELTKILANRGSVNMQLRLGHMYANGWGVAKDEGEGLKWYRAAAAQGSPIAQNVIGWAYHAGSYGLTKDDAEAMRWIKKAAEKEFVQAFVNIGFFYETGIGAAKDISEATRWYRKAALLGHGGAQGQLGWIYLYGTGMPKDEKEGVKWLKEAVKQGNGYALNSLGATYERGIGGLEKNYAEALSYYKKAAENNNSYGYHNVGRIFYNGIGVSVDKAEAAKWFEGGAKLGNIDSQSQLGWMYMTGNGVTIDQGEAMRWFKAAADKGDAFSQSKIGYIYGQGLGVAQDFVEAYAWSNLAAISKQATSPATVIEASAYRDMVAKKLTSDQLYQARVRSDEIDLKIKMALVGSTQDTPKKIDVAIKSSDNDELLSLASSIKSAQEDPKKWLFAVAIEKYDEADGVIYAVASAKAFVAAMQKRLGISERQTYTLFEDKATTGSIKTNLERLVRHVKPGDSIYFYYSGHGIPDAKDGEAYILPKDASPEFIGGEKEFMVRNIYKKLSSSKAGKVVVFIDSCYSGRTDGVSNIKGVAAGHFKTKKIEFDNSKMVVLTAGSASQFSNAFKSKKHRLFTYYLTKALAERPTLDIKSIYQEVAVKVKDESFKMGDTYLQEPQIEGNLGLGL